MFTEFQKPPSTAFIAHAITIPIHYMQNKQRPLKCGMVLRYYLSN